MSQQNQQKPTLPSGGVIAKEERSAQFCRDTGANPTTGIDIVNGRAQLNANYYRRREEGEKEA